MDRNNDIKVTVVCITYKHEAYIAEALDSFLMQKTNFKYQIFVGEDCGPDDTAEIVREYARKFPNIVIPFIREKNMGAQRNLIDLCNHAVSPYIAFCEGDDYWTDEYKLQKQYDYMEANPELRVCFAKAEIRAPEDWFLNSYYKRDAEGRMIFPECDPSYKKKDGFLKADSFISFLQAHTSTLFYRWDYNLDIPEWYYDGYIGDWPLFLMQLGNGEAGFIPDIVSVYRRSDVGVYMSKNLDEHFLKTREENVRLLSGMIDYYEQNFPGDYPKILIENRIKRDVMLFIQAANKIGEWDRVISLLQKYEYAGKLALNTYIGFYNDSIRMTAYYTWEGNKLIARNKYFLRMFKIPVRLITKIVRAITQIKNRTLKSVVYIFKLAGYWFFGLIPKRKKLWVCSGFYKRNFSDNTRYFYEYINENHSDISVIWLTKDSEVLERLRGEGKPVCRLNSLKGIAAMARAQVAITDHFVMSDYSSIYGFNFKTKVVQLWHGVGFKAMGNGKLVLNTDVKGVRYSNDILPSAEDNILKRIQKDILFFLKAPVRELFERYFMLVCPGQERIEMIGNTWNIPPSSYFLAGHPRNINLYSTEIPKEKLILYAPTYRFNDHKEKDMIDLCLESLPKIQACMEKNNSYFIIRLHPHTWRNYSPRILHHIQSFNRIQYDTEKDIYSMLHKYSVVITDYSSIALDFAMINRPVIFYTFDYEWFCKHEAGFNLDFQANIPGPQTYSWDETLHRVQEYVEDPKKDSDLRKKRCAYFFDEASNGPDNSERIYKEIKRRLQI
ncbi:glycosyltransferase [Clostridium sp. AF18-27]|uniref:bifunctional glycosyltransferase/CDP-glycerol:glycerophosphate glycerophosphotransferase n=1 Tax=Enterocloster lavalensis TaxID=460384 RepID=UPI000E470525|nr:CDP-glycerol glycerophosphotransferase family protein [Enterocloster lavalensis]RHR51894.1 glycosyltransferase [Clostridium sp. AF18-27]